MRPFLWNILLALTWALMNGRITLSNLLVGFILGYFALMLFQSGKESSNYFKKVRQILVFFFWFFKELLLSNLQVAHDVVTPTHYSRPGILAIPLDAKTPAEITLLANVISLTPGTLSLDVSDDRKTLYIHAMFIDDPEKLRRAIKEGLEKRLLEVMR